MSSTSFGRTRPAFTASPSSGMATSFSTRPSFRFKTTAFTISHRSPRASRPRSSGWPSAMAGCGRERRTRHQHSRDPGRVDTRSTVTRDLIASKTPEGVIVDDADGLHPGVDDGGADELEPASLHFLRDRLGGRRLRRKRSSIAHDDLPTAERPAEVSEVFAAVGHLAEDSGAGDGGLDLRARPNDVR